MFGHTAARASCGLFQPATYRVVSLAPEHSICTLGLWPTRAQALPLHAPAGRLSRRAASGRRTELVPTERASVLQLQVGDVFAGQGRQSLEFQLNARPSAVIDLSDALREAGHTVPEK